MKSCINPACPATLRGQTDETTVCGGCGGTLFVLPEGSALPAYEATPPAPAPSGETAPEPTPAPPVEETIPAGERGVSEEEALALAAAARAADEETDTPEVPAAPAVPAPEAVPTPADLGIPTPTTRATPAPVPTTEVIRNRPAPSADPAPTPRHTSDPGISPKLKAAIDNAAVIADLEAQRRAREAARPAPRPAANDDTEDTFFEPTRPAPRASRQPDLKVPTTNRSWLWLVAAAVVLIGVLGWWLLRKHNDGAASQPAIAATDTTAPSSSVDSVARSIARNAQNSADRAITGVQQVSGRVTALENQQDGRRGFLVADSLTCEYANFGACVASLMENGDQRLVTAGIISQAEARASAERTCRATGCGAE